MLAGGMLPICRPQYAQSSDRSSVAAWLSSALMSFLQQCRQLCQAMHPCIADYAHQNEQECCDLKGIPPYKHSTEAALERVQ